VVTAAIVEGLPYEGQDVRLAFFMGRSWLSGLVS